MTASNSAASAPSSRIDVFFDYASPFAYIASEILPSRLDDTGLDIRWRPIELEALR